MSKKSRLIYILILCAVIVAGAAIYVIQLPGNNLVFQQENASQDTIPFKDYAKGVVSEVVFEQIDDVQNAQSITQQLKVTLTDTDRAGEEVEINNTQILDKAGSTHYKVGDRVVLGLVPTDVAAEYVILDRYRLPGVYIIVAAFLLLAVIVGRKRGLTSLVGLGITGCILLLFIAPQILSGKDPFLVAIVGAGAIVLVSMFISHGFNKRIQISAISTIIALAFTALIAYIFVYISRLFGFGQSDAFLLETGYLGSINLRGILLAGIVISVLGVLDDVTTAQTAAVEELHKTDPALSVKDLYRKGLSIGREHIASLINTLILVYAGAALPLFLLLTLQKSQPIWVLLNSEFIAEELVRSLIGSIALILAVPISTLLAAYIYTYKPKNQE
jgi:uncharacterized membrane protein